MDKPLIVAHRGASGDAPENTMAAFNLAWEQGADAVECDVWMTSDGELVCIHDETTRRTSNKNLDVTKTTLAELQNLDAGGWKGEQWKGTRIPTLNELLASIPEGKIVYIEIKAGAGTVSTLKTVIDESGLAEDQVVIISFNKDVILEVRQAMPDIKTLLTFNFKQGLLDRIWRPSFDSVVQDVKEVGAHGVDVRARKIVDAEFFAMMRDMGCEIHVWTVNDPEAAKRFTALGVDSITTDVPGMLREGMQAT